MIILGIDPGTTRIGYGIIKQERNRFVAVRYGTISHLEKDRLSQIKKITADLSGLIQKYRPDIAGVESLFFFKNKKTVIAVSEMRGVILSVLAEKNINFKEFTPLQVKQSVSSYGRAGKDQVEQMVRLILDIKTRIKPDDAADALAIAICCANTIL